VVLIFYGATRDLFGTPVWPVTRMMLQLIDGGYLFMAVVILVYYAGEIVHRERQTRVAEYVDAMPWPNGVAIAAKLTSLVFVLLMVLLASLVAAVIVQALHGYTRFELPVYAFGLFVVQAAFPLLLCVAAVAVQSVVANKFVGMLVIVLGFLAFGALGELGFEHPLYTFGTPPVPLSDMNGFGHFVEPFVAVTAYWAAIMVAVAIGAHLFFQRGLVTSAAERLPVARARFTPGLKAATAVALLAAAGIGSFIFYNTNVLNAYRTEEDVERLKAEYERRYKGFEGLAMPEAVDITAQVDLFPDERRVESRGRAFVENVHPVPIEEIHVSVPRLLRVNALEIEGGTLAEEDVELGYRKFRLDAPLAPGGRLEVAWDLSWLNPGFVHARGNTRIVENGTFVDSTEIFPAFGYVPDNEIRDNNKRRKYGLPPARRLPEYDAADDFAPGQALVRKRANFRTRLSTASDQIAIAPGYLVREWTEAGRRHFEYEMDAPIWPFASFSSARYAVERGQWNDVAIEVYFHPPHDFNVARMIAATQKSLDYFTREFSPYPYRQFRILEFPAYARFAQSFPNTVPYSEAIGFIANLSDPKHIDYVFYVTAHELAHQWWGHQVIGRYAQGMTLIVETLAQYSALMVMEKEYGARQMRRFLRYELDNYLSNRGGELIEELPLSRVEDQGYIHYRKGSVAMYALKDAIGEDALNRALRSFLAKYAFRETPFPRSGDLIAEFRAVAAPEHQQLITDLFERIVLWDLAVESVSTEAIDDGRTRVTLEVRAAKREADGQGRETEVPLDEVLDLGVYPKADASLGERDLPEPLAFERVRVRSGTNRFEVVVDGEPDRVGIDPLAKRIDRNPDDNLRRVE
jgi:ABC-2 type transport system permease protein